MIASLREGIEAVKEDRPLREFFVEVPRPFEAYTPERVAEFLLSNAVDAVDYAEAVKKVRSMGLDPRKIKHVKPGKDH